MFSDPTQWLKSARSPDEISTMKTYYFDRLEIELPTGNVAFEGLAQVYVPTLSFFQWVTKSKETHLETDVKCMPRPRRRGSQDWRHWCRLVPPKNWSRFSPPLTP
jgi:hypothetical protein